MRAKEVERIKHIAHKCYGHVITPEVVAMVDMIIKGQPFWEVIRNFEHHLNETTARPLDILKIARGYREILTPEKSDF